MIIHISQTSQSYLVPEKKMIIFLKHAGASQANIDMDIQWPLLADAKPAPRAHSWGLAHTKAAPRDNDSSLDSNTSSCVVC